MSAPASGACLILGYDPTEWHILRSYAGRLLPKRREKLRYVTGQAGRVGRQGVCRDIGIY